MPGNVGFREEKVSDWRELNEFIEDYFFSDPNFVFRGQSCSNWGLNTTLDRLLRQVPEEFRHEKIVYNHLDRFYRALRGRRTGNVTKNESTNENDLWALGQHYGLATPLLDWSFSPYIALFFAFNDPSPASSGERALWALDLKKVKEINVTIDDYVEIKRASGEALEFGFEVFEGGRTPIIELFEPLSDDNPRIISQAGMFTRLPVLTALNEWVINFCGTSYKDVLLKVTVSEDERDNVIWALEKMNIHSASLFPDINGASKYCNEMLSILSRKKEIEKAANTLCAIAGIPTVEKIFL